MENCVMTQAPVGTLYDFYEEMTEHNLRVIFEGEFNQEITKYVLSLTEKSFGSGELDSSVKKKIFNVMMEGLQNICKHQYAAIEKDDPSFQPAIFIVGTKGEDYFIITGNLVRKDAVEPLRIRIDDINSKDREELKQMYKEARLQSKLSEVGGAGLGLIDMARKSGNKLVYRFDNAGNDMIFFSLMTSISSKKEEQ